MFVVLSCLCLIYVDCLHDCILFDLSGLYDLGLLLMILLCLWWLCFVLTLFGLI